MAREILDSRLRVNDTSKGRYPDRWGIEDDTPPGLVVGNGLQAQVGTDGGPVLLEFIGGGDPNANYHISLNGFEMWVWVPEPASGTLAWLGLAGVGLGLAGRRLRNRQKGS